MYLIKVKAHDFIRFVSWQPDLQGSKFYLQHAYCICMNHVPKTLPMDMDGDSKLKIFLA